jgi:glycosyltransferase involved in cell wall biosynthesis
MKILYISHCRENSGYGVAARNYLKAMIEAGLDVVSRPIIMNNSSVQLSDDLLELEKKSSKGCEVNIQHILPSMMSYNGNMKNIGMCILETHNIYNSIWYDKLSLMDELWYPNSIIKLGFNNQKLIPHACNVEEYKQSYTPMDINGDFKFYFIGELNKRKNIAAILRAFHLEFSIEEPVSLVLKINKPGYDAAALFKETEKICKTVKQGLRIHKNIDALHSEIVITDYLSREDILKLHETCNCYINASRGEAWEYSCFDAASMGNDVICSRNIGSYEYLKEYKHTSFVYGAIENVYGAIDAAVPDVFTGRELWFEINISSLRRSMRSIFNEHKNKNTRLHKEDGLNLANMYSYSKIGNLIKSIL